MTETNHPIRIMVVEDDADVSLALSARLRHEGFDVYEASDAISAVATGRREKPDLALIDVNLPGGSGFDVAERLDRWLSGTGLKKVFITASKKPGLLKRALAAGGATLVEKPFTAAVLLRAIEEARDGNQNDPPETFG